MLTINPQTDPILGYRSFVFVDTILHPDTQVPIVEAGENADCSRLHALRLAGIDCVHVDISPWEAYADNLRADYRVKHDKPRWRTR